MNNKAIFAAGCFWGVQYYFQKAKGVLSSVVGYSGGSTKNPSYKEVCYENTGHYEVIEVTFDPGQTNFEELTKLFFSIHDFSQTNGQGPDLGQQYLSVIFYLDEEQKQIAEKIIQQLKDKDYSVATILKPAEVVYPAEEYHQNYYSKNGHEPYCHAMKKIF